MRSILYLLTVLACLPTLAQNKGPYVVSTYQKDGKIVTDTIYEKETIRATYDSIIENFYIEKSEKSFNEKGQLILKKLNPPKGNVFNQTYIKYTYDSLGFLIKEASYNANDQLQNGYSDIAVYQHKNDTAGNQIETRYLGEKMELIRIEFIGPAIVKRKFNNLNQKIEEAFFDENNKHLQDLAKVVWTYDNKGNETSKTLYNAKELEGTK